MSSNKFDIEFAIIKNNFSQQTSSLSSSTKNIEFLLEAQTRLKNLCEKYPEKSELTISFSNFINKNLEDTEFFVLNDQCFSITNKFGTSTLSHEQKIEIICDLKVVVKNFIKNYPVHTEECKNLLQLFEIFEKGERNCLPVVSQLPETFWTEQVIVGFFTVFGVIFILIFLLWFVYKKKHSSFFSK